MMPSVQHLEFGENWVMQLDNEPKHDSKITTEWVKNKRIQVCNGTVTSPDPQRLEYCGDDVRY